MALLETQFTWTCTYIPVPVTFPSGPISTENHRLCPLFKIITTNYYKTFFFPDLPYYLTYYHPQKYHSVSKL